MRDGRLGRITLILFISAWLSLAVIGGLFCTVSAAPESIDTDSSEIETDAPGVEAGNSADILHHQRNTTNDSQLAAAAGESITVIVRFDELRETGENSHISVRALQTHAEATQDSFIQKFEPNPHVDIRASFWITNAVLVDIDTSAVALSELNEIDYVDRLHTNFEASVMSSDVASPPTGAMAIGMSDSTASPASETSTETAAVTAADTTTYGIEMINAPDVWEQFETQGGDTTVAVLDTGIDPDHNDVTVAAWSEFDEHGDEVPDSEPFDANGHGTHVAGTVGGGNASGTAIGVAPETALYGVKTFEDDGTATFAQILGGMQWATERGEVDILQLSFGAEGTADGFIDPIRNANRAGKVVVASAGNSGVNTSASPGNVYDAVAAGAVNEDRDVASFSSGERIDTATRWEDPPWDWPDEYIVPDVTAPGVLVVSAEAGTTTGVASKSGTSMAAPHISGALALAISATDDDTTVEELQAALQTTAVHPNSASEPDNRYGHGIVDAFELTADVTDTEIDTPYFAVEEFTAPETATTGETIAVSATIRNTGDRRGEQDVAYRFDQTTVATETIELEPDSETTVEFTFDTENVDAGEYEHSISSDNESATEPITIEQAPTPPFFAMADLEAPTSAPEGSTITVNATVANAGEVEDSQNVELRLNESGAPLDSGATVASELVVLDGSDETTVSFETTLNQSAGNYTIGVFSTDSNVTASLTVTTALSDDTAHLSFEDQLSDSRTVSVRTASVSEEFVIGIHLDDNGGQLVGTSETLSGGIVAENVTVDLTTRLSHRSVQNVTARLYSAPEDSTANVGEPVIRNDTPVEESANVSVDGRLQYVDPDRGQIRAQGLFDAAADFRSGSISGNLLLDVAAAYRAGTTFE